MKEQLAATYTPPNEPNARLEADRFRDRIANVRERSKCGPREALEEALRIASEAENLGHPPLEAESLQLVGELQMSLQELGVSRDTLERAAESARSAGHDAVEALAQIQIAHVARQLENRSDAADSAIELAEAALKNHENLNTLRVLLRSVSGMRQLDKGNTAKAIESLQEAVTLGERVLGDSHPRVAGLLRNLAEVYRSMGHSVAAREIFRRSIAILEQSHGARSPLAAAPLAGLAQTLLDLGQADEAIEKLDRQREAYLEAYGPDCGRLAKTHSLKGEALAQKKEFDAALEQHDEAVRIAEKAYGRDHWRVGRSHRYLGDTLLMQRSHERALEAFRKGWAIYEQQAQPGDVELAHIRAGIGRAHLEARRPKEALEPLEYSIEIWEDAGAQCPRDLLRARDAYERARKLTGDDKDTDLDEGRSGLPGRTQRSKHGPRRGRRNGQRETARNRGSSTRFKTQQEAEERMADPMSSPVAQFHIDAAEHFAREAASEEVGKNPQTRRAYVLAALKAASSAARAELRIITGTDPMRAELPIADLDTFLSSLDQIPQARAERRLLGFATRLAKNAEIEIEGDTFEKAAMGLLTVELANWGIRAVVETIRSVKSSLLGTTDIVAGCVVDAPA